MYEIVYWWNGGLSEVVYATDLTYEEALAFIAECEPDSEDGSDGTEIREVE